MNKESKVQPVIFLMGPTASGKTKLAIELHQQLGCELISVDSALVYRGLDIGTAKPTAKELAAAPHHLINICDPETPYSAHQFCMDAKLIIDDIFSRGKIPLLVGGSMLYFKALRDGLADLPQAESAIRVKMSGEAEEKGWSAMHLKLAAIDPESALRINPGDSQRIQRALEVFMISGKTMSQYFKEQKGQSLNFPIISLAIVPPEREILRQRISQRFERMLDQGFVKEVEYFYHQKGLSADLPAMRCVGYRQVYQYLAGKIDFQTMQEKAVAASHQLAKRQMTWLRKWPDLTWIETGSQDNISKIRQMMLHYIGTT